MMFFARLSLCLLLLCLACSPAPCQTLDGKPAMEYDWLEDFSEGLAGVRKNDKWGFIDRAGKEVVPCKYDSVVFFFNGFAKVKLNEKWGFIDKTGKEIIPCKYEESRYFYNSFARVKNNNKWGFIDKTGKEILPCKYEYIGYFDNGFVKANLNSKWGLIDIINGREIILCKCDYIIDFNDNLLIIKVNGKCGFIDKTGKEIVPCKYDNFGYFNDGFAGVEFNGKWGLIDKTGKEVVPCEYDNVGYFKYSFARVQLKGKWGFIDQTGKEVIPCEYEEVTDFYGSFAQVKLNGKWGFIDQIGKEITPCKYEYVINFYGSFAQVKLNGKWGFIDQTGKEVIPCEYEEVTDFYGSFAQVKLNGKWGIIKNPLLYPPKPKTSIILTQVGETSRISDSYSVIQPTLYMEGRIESQEKIAMVKINEQELFLKQSLLTFQDKITLAKGKNILVIRAYDAAGKELASHTLTVTYQPQKNSLEDAKYYALLIAAQDYKDYHYPPLRKPIADAKALSQALEKYNFKVAIHENVPNRQEMETAIENFIKQYGYDENANLLIFFSGHGIYDQSKQMGYWLPCDAKNDVYATYFANSALNDHLKGVKAKHILVIADACHAGAICDKGAVEKKVISDKEIARGLYGTGSRKAMTSGNQKETVSDESVFIAELIGRLSANKEPYLTASALFELLREKVVKERKTTPQHCPLDLDAPQQGGEFIFQKK